MNIDNVGKYGGVLMAKIVSDIKSGVQSVTATAKRKTKRFAEATKLALDIKMEESNLEHCFEMLGRAVYANTKNSNNEERIKSLIEQADKISATIKDYKERLAFLQDKEICAHCESVIERGFPCRYCNEKIVANKKENN